MIDELTKEIKKPTAAPRTYEISNTKILFDELIVFLDAKLQEKDAVPESVKIRLKKEGKKVGLISVLGYNRLYSAFCETYPRLLSISLKPGENAPIENIDMYNRTVNFVRSKCDEYTTLVKTNAKGISVEIKREYDEVVRENKRIMYTEKRELTDEEKEKETVYENRDSALKNANDRARRYLRDCGWFLLYLGANDINMSDVDSETFVEFQDMFAASFDTHPKISTINDIRKMNMPFFSHLSKTLKTRLPYMAPIPESGEGSIPIRAYELDTRPKATEAFGVAIDDRKRVLTKSCEMCDIYAAIRDFKVCRDPMLAEICIRILRETGLRPVHALRIRWGGFTNKPAKEVKRFTVYTLLLGEISDLKRGRKGVPFYNMYISQTLGAQIIQYRKDNPELSDHDRVFSGVKLIGWDKSKSGVKMRRESLLHNVMIPISEAMGVNVRSKKLRNSYYTVMLNALHVDDSREFKRWTGDLKTTAEDHYEGIVGTVRIPDILSAHMSYSEVVAVIFDKERSRTCTQGELGYPKVCKNGKTIYRKRCDHGVWVDSGQRCRGK